MPEPGQAKAAPAADGQHAVHNARFKAVRNLEFASDVIYRSHRGRFQHWFEYTP